MFVVCHPVEESYCGALADRAIGAAESIGHEVRAVSLYGDGFDPRIGLEEWRGYRDRSPRPADLEHYVESLRWCDSLVFVYPTWFGCQPAMLKGFLERVLTPDLRLRNIRRLLVVTTHGSPKFLNAVQGEPGKRVMLRGVRSRCHPLTNGRWLAMYGNDRNDPRARADFLNQVEAQLLRL